MSYFGLNPRVRQSGLGVAQHGRISKHGRSHARGLLVEAAWGSVQSKWSLARLLPAHPRQARVATARKLTVLIWHMLTKQQDYLWIRPALVAAKERQLALKAGAKPERGVGRRGSAYAYNVKGAAQPGEGQRRAGRASLRSYGQELDAQKPEETIGEAAPGIRQRGAAMMAASEFRPQAHAFDKPVFTPERKMPCDA